MKIKKGLTLAASCLVLSIPVMAENIVKVPRENGALHQEFKNLLNDYISKFDSGVGRIHLSGKSGSDSCEVDFYTNDDTTFVTLNVDKGGFYNEFYIDHPTQSFRKILFQNLIMRDDGVELKVVRRDGGYSILTDGEKLVLASKSEQGKDSSCEFKLTHAALYNGETE